MAASEEEPSEVYAAYDDDLCGGQRYDVGKWLERIIWVDDKGRFHRDGDLPAAIWRDGEQEWSIHGITHRDNDMPAIVEKDGTRLWFKHDNQHRDGGLPAVMGANGIYEWWVHGKMTGESGDPPEGAVFPGQLVKPCRRSPSAALR